MDENRGGQRSWIAISVVAIAALILLAIVLLAISQVRNAARRITSANNLRQLALAAVNYESANSAFFPQASVPIQNSDYEISWEVQLTPFLESSDFRSRYNEFVAWDNPENAALLSHRCFPCFNNPCERSANFDHEGYSLNHYAANSDAIGLSEPQTFDSIAQRGETILFAEVCAGYQPFGRPGNARPFSNGIKFDSTSLGNPIFPGVTVANVDGSTTFIDSDITRLDKISYREYRRSRRDELPSRLDVLNHYCHLVEYSPPLDGNLITFRLIPRNSKSYQPEMDGRAIDDPGLKLLSNLGNIKGVVLGHSSEVTQDGIGALAELPNLNYLNLGNVQLGNEGIAQLARLKELKELLLNQSELDAEQLEQLAKALPYCKIKSTGPGCR